MGVLDKLPVAVGGVINHGLKTPPPQQHKSAGCWSSSGVEPSAGAISADEETLWLCDSAMLRLEAIHFLCSPATMPQAFQAH